MTAVLFAGGGSGGHIYPAIAIAEALRQRAGDDLECIYLHSDRPLDADILDRQGAAHAALPARPPVANPLGFARFLAGWAPSLRETRAHLRRLAQSHERIALVATGGFVSPPAVQAARVERTPRLLVNLDAVPGRANRWCARRVDRILTALPLRNGPDPAAARAPGFHPAGPPPHARSGGPNNPGSSRRPPFDAHLVGPIVRASARAPADAAGCRELLGLDPERPTLLVTGASQGAASLNRFMAHLATQRPRELDGWQVIHQTGPTGAEDLEAAYANVGVPALLAPFMDPMGPAWGAADLALARAGAGTVAEAWANRVPTLFAPFPRHRDQHQRHNAAPLVAAGAAALAEDRTDPEKNMDTLGPALRELLADAPKRRRMHAALGTLGPTDGATAAAEALLDLTAPH